jgi:hypothetical protein
MSTRKTNRPRLSVQSLEGREVCTTLIEVGNIPRLTFASAAVQVSVVKVIAPVALTASAPS